MADSDQLQSSISFHHDRHVPSPSPPPPAGPSLTAFRTDSNHRFTLETMHKSTAKPRCLVFTPSSPPVVVSPLRKALSSSQLVSVSVNKPLENDSFSEDEATLHTVGKRPERNAAAIGLRPRVVGTGNSKFRSERLISTGSVKGAGETETELDEPPRHLPTSRRIPTPPPLTPLTPLARLTPLLFQIFRLLSVVPAIAGACYHLYNLYQPKGAHVRLDHVVCVLWALLTAHQCLKLTTGLLVRWKAYYPPLPTLIRLLALQAICWPATQYTLILFNHDHRPVVCWAIIGSTTCVSRSIQIWVTSNLWGPSNLRLESKGIDSPGVKWGPRRWDWTEVGVKCALPMGVVYFVMAWVEALRRELSGC